MVTFIIDYYLFINQGLIELKLETTNNTEIRAAVVFAEGIFKNESIVIYPHNDLVNNIISVELRPPKDIAIDLHVKALVGYRASSHFHVFEISRHLPRFAMYGFLRNISLSKNGTNTDANNNFENGMDDQGNFLMSYKNGFNESSYQYEQEWDQMSSTFNNRISNTNFNAEVVQPQSYIMFRIFVSLSKVVISETIKKLLGFLIKILIFIG